MSYIRQFLVEHTAKLASLWGGDMTSSLFDQTNRSAAMSALSDQVFDLLVIGGGITGAGVARDAAKRG